MIADIVLPSGHLGMYPRVSMDTELTGEHHEMFLSSPETLFERTVASVISSLLKSGDVNKLAFIDLIYLFMTVRAVSISPVYKTEWQCKREVTPKNAPKQECGGKNSFSLNLSKIPVVFVPKGMKYPQHQITVSTDAGDITTNMYVRFLTVSEEFDTLDELAEEGITKDKFTETKNLYRYSRERLLRAMTFEDSRVNELSHDKRDLLLKKIPIGLMSSLFADSKALDKYGPDLSARTVSCEKCKGESRLVIPFSAQFLLS